MRRVVRPPAVAGRFYPAEAGELEETVRGFLSAAEPADTPPRPVALVGPHAGYMYSGAVAGSAYALLDPHGKAFRRVVLVGPSHFVTFEGIALPECDAFATPLGEHAVDAEAVAALLDSPIVHRWGRPHREEHCLEVHLPFVRIALGALPILPLLTGFVESDEVADALDLVWTPETLVVVSTDLSHYLPYADARRLDARTADAVERLHPDALGDRDACGVMGLRGLLASARRRGLRARCVDLRSSGDTGGGHARVVGYGAFGFWKDAG